LNVFNRPVLPKDKLGILTNPISVTREVVLSYRHSVFTLKFAALNFANSEQNAYAYKLEGFEDQWNNVGNRRFATYTNLDPGNYVFRVKASNNDGIWNETGAALGITILPPFWKTIWFKLASILVIGFLIKHFIDDQIRRRKMIQVTALANLNQLKLLRMQMNPHFLFNALGSIRSMILLNKQQAWQMVSELAEFFRYTLANFNKIETTLQEEISAVQNYLHIERIRFKDSLLVTFEVDESACGYHVPAFIFQPLVENAIKYGMQTSTLPLQIIVKIDCQDDVLSIDVSNSGRLLHRSSEKNEVHGASLENIQKRLAILFNDHFSFRLFEADGWVHAKIRINAQELVKGEKSAVT